MPEYEQPEPATTHADYAPLIWLPNEDECEVEVDWEGDITDYTRTVKFRPARRLRPGFSQDR